MRLNGHDVDAPTVTELLRKQRMLGDKPLAIVENDVLTYAEADIRANRVANSLIELGVSKGDVVLTYMHNSTNHLSAWFGIARAGAIWAPINTALINWDLTYTIVDAMPKVIIVDSELLPNVLAIREEIGEFGTTIIVNGGEKTPAGLLDFSRLLEGSPEDPKISVEPSDPASIVYTGGSTGLPKGVVVSSIWHLPAVLRYDEMFKVRPDDVHLGIGQMFHAIGSAVDVLCPMYWGLTTVMSRWFSASRFWDIASKHNCTIVGVFIGPLMITLMNQPRRLGESENMIRIASSGSGQVPREAVEAFKQRFGIELLEIYGQTETGALGAIGQRLDDMPYHSLGRPHGWCEVAVVDPDDNPCEAGVQGEIVLRPTYPHTFLLEYHNKPDKFVEACRNLWFHTGDVGHLDEEGYLHFDGRLSHSIRRRGENIAALEVEGAMLRHPAVAECAVVGVPAELGEEDVRAFVQLKPGAEADPADLVRFCAEQIAYFKVPRYIEFVDDMPRSAAKGEIERFKLRDVGLDRTWDRETAGVVVRRQG